MVGEPHITLVASLRVYLYGSESNKVKVPVTWLTPSGTSLTEDLLPNHSISGSSLNQIETSFSVNKATFK